MSKQGQWLLGLPYNSVKAYTNTGEQQACDRVLFQGQLGAQRPSFT